MADGGGVDDGYFPAGCSVLRRVVGERIVGLGYGVRGAVVGAMEAGAFIGTNLHTVGRDGSTFSRLKRTHAAFETAIFGTRAEADAVSARVAAMHRTVRGTIGKDLGPGYPAGTPYSATDPWLSWMTMAFLADSAHAIHTTYVGSLTPEEEQACWEDWLVFGRLFGMPDGAAPATWTAFREEYDAWMASDRAYLIPSARKAGEAVMRLPLPPVLRAANALTAVLLVPTLPAPVREAYELTWSPAQEVAHQAIRRTYRVGRPMLPSAVARGRVGGVVDRVASLAEPGQKRKVAASRTSEAA